MSAEFIKEQINNPHILKATRQERQLAYFTLSDIQEDYVSAEYYKQWAERNFQTDDYFLNYVKGVLKTDNFLTFTKYVRKPLPSAKIVNNRIVPQLRKVFNAENSEFKYIVEGHSDTDFNEILNTSDFEKELFNRILFKHNSIIIASISDGEPYRFFVDIKDVKAVECSKDGKILRLAFVGIVNDEQVYIYVDGESFKVYDKEYNEIEGGFEHGLNHCPAHFISPKTVNNPIVRESIFTYIREELEEYTFLKTLQKMTEPNGAIPIVTQLDVDIEDVGKDVDGGSEINVPDSMSSQKATHGSDNPPTGDSTLQVGSVLKVPIIEKADGSVDIDTVRNLINFHYVPVESLNYIKDRISGIETSIISTVVGGMINGTIEGSKNEMQVEESMTTLQNTLIYFADRFNIVRKMSDTDLLLLKYRNLVREVSIFYGSDFFLDSESTLYNNLEKARNPIEKKNILIRINQNRYRGNQNKLERQKILYDLIPYVSDADFNLALSKEGFVDDITFKYQTQFNYWIGRFEELYGDIVTFYTLLDVEKPLKLGIINELILNIIREK